MHAIFVRGVTKRGHLDVDPDSTCVVSVEGDDGSAELLRSREALLEYRLHVPARGASRPPASPSCENQLRLRLSPGTARYPEAKAIVVQNQSAEPRFEAAFPTERPALDPKRWGWLIVAPILDAATIAVGIPYAGLVGVFEGIVVGLILDRTSVPNSVVLTTSAGDGTATDTILVRIESDGQLFVSANHWPRAWYNQALENPNVQVTLAGEKGDYLAVPATEEEHARVDGENSRGIVFKIMTGFPPRYFFRLDPR